MGYVAPTRKMLFTALHVAGLEASLNSRPDSPISLDLVEPVLDEAAKITQDVVSPLNQFGDRTGVQLLNGVVTCPEGYRQAYQEWIAAGWNGISLPAEWGGAGAPVLLSSITMEMITSACLALAMSPVLTQGAADVLIAHASEALKSTYGAKLVSGAWTATMAITESQSGSDLSELRTTAEPDGEDTYRIRGEKIFISFGDHDLADNILHLVLARIKGAPSGTRGLSLFAVPKYLPRDDGSPGEKNDLRCAGIEHKMGIHGSPTCTMVYGENDGAIGWLVGEQSRGLAAMFTMMNRARLATGLQGVAVGERAFQQAHEYAKSRRQGRRPGSIGMALLVEHPDVKRTLSIMRALVSASRCVAYFTAAAIDAAESGAATDARAKAEKRAALLTPIVKGFASDTGFEVASLGVQIHGGMGYVEETGAAQHLRDARIISIYEGTNGIQAIDLLFRKVVSDNGDALLALFDELSELIFSANTGALKPYADAALDAIEAARAATTFVLFELQSDDERLACASAYARLAAVAISGALLFKAALAAESLSDFMAGEYVADAKIFLTQISPTARALLTTIRAGAEPILAAAL